jgi:hypothetical protein
MSEIINKICIPQETYHYQDRNVMTEDYWNYELCEINGLHGNDAIFSELRRKKLCFA